MSDNIVADWLKTIGLESYVQAFLDNGYDELEVCKQIGDPDLDAIGVSKGNHRRKILQAVVKLKEEGGTSVYFTLETQGNGESEEISTSSKEKRLSRNSDEVSSVKESVPTSPITLNSGNQLRDLVRNKIIKDGINLLCTPYTRRDWTGCRMSLEGLGAKYAQELKANSHDVVDLLEELRQWLLHRDSEIFYSSSSVGSPSLSGTTRPSVHSLSSLQNHQHHHVVPPALPHSLPPCTSHVDMGRSTELHSVANRHDASIYNTNYMTLETGMCCIPIMSTRESMDGDRRKTSTLGRFFRNMGIRRSGKKHHYKQHNGDPVAYSITMGDDDRMALMLLVKEGKLTTEQALQMVKDYEDERRRELQNQNEKKGTQKKKKQGSKPVKSPSATMPDASKRCDVCQRQISYEQTTSGNVCTDPSHRFECFQHRRVHSVSHIDFAEFPRSPEATRAMSCTPTRGYLGYGSRSPVTFYTPSHNSRIYSPVMSHDGKYYPIGQPLYSPGSDYHHGNMLRTSVSIHNSPSQVSSMSLESEQSMECQNHGPTPGEMAAMRGDNLNYGSNSSAMSMTSDISPAGNWRKPTTGEDQGQGHKAKYNSDTVKSVSSDDCNHSGSSGTTASMHSASPGSGKSCSSMEEVSSAYQDHPSSSLVRVMTDYTPTKSEVDMLQIKKGDVIWVASRTSPGLWKGVLNGRTGWFKPSYTEPCTPSNETVSSQKVYSSRKKVTKKTKPKSVQELLRRIGLECLENLFIQNGFDHLETFCDLNEEDLTALRIYDPQQRAKLLTAADLLLNMDDSEHVESPDQSNASRYPCHTSLCYSPRMVLTGEFPNTRSCPVSRDSGCYGSWEQLGLKEASNKIVYGVKNPNTLDKDKTFSPLQHSNKENVQPGLVSQKLAIEQRLGSRQTNSSGRGSASSGRASVETCPHYGDLRTSDMERSDREFTEEDREVCEITRGAGEEDSYCYNLQNTPQSSVDMTVISAESSIIMCSYAGTQTSPNQASNSLDTANNIKGYKPKPFPRKSLPKSAIPSKDVQVQVMCPLGSSTNSKVDFESYQIRNNSKDAMAPFQRQHSSPAFPVHKNVDYHRKYSETMGVNCGKLQNGDIPCPNQVQYDRVPKSRARSIDESARLTSSPRDVRGVKKSLVSMVTSKLAAEKIDLTTEPYTSKSGHCGIPPLLMQRYADELKHDLPSVCLVLEQVRIHTLNSFKKTVIPADNLADTCATGCELKILPIPEFFVAIGLPMYIDNLIGQNFTSLEQLFELTNQELRDITGASHKHSKRIIHALEWLKRKKMKGKGNEKDAAKIDRV